MGLKHNTAKAAEKAKTEAFNVRVNALYLYRNLEIALKRGIWTGAESHNIASLLRYVKTAVAAHLTEVRKIKPEFENEAEKIAG